MQQPDCLLLFGASSTIGQALIQCIAKTYPDCNIIAISRTASTINTPAPNIIYETIDYQNSQSLQHIVDTYMDKKAVYWVICTIGILHQADHMPEKSIKNIDMDFMQQIFLVNTIIPSLILKYVLPKLPKQLPSVVALLSARVGSISDNRLGGWYSYRASKAALNMIIKSAAIEMHRFHPHNITVGLHPGTVNSPLSVPFQKNVKADKLFTADYSAEQLIKVIQQLTAQDTGHCFAWDGQQIEP